MAEDSAAVAAAKDQAAIEEAKKNAAEHRLAAAKAEAALALIGATAKADAEKVLAEAQSAVLAKQQAASAAAAAAIAADQAVVKAGLGAVSAATGLTPGEVAAATGAGDLEASLLSARTIARLGNLIAEAIEETESTGKRDCVIFTGVQKPDFSALRLYEFRRSTIAELFDLAKRESDAADVAFDRWKRPAKPPAAKPAAAKKAAMPAAAAAVDAIAAAHASLHSFALGPAVGAAVTGAGALLETAAKLGSFFQTSYSVAKLDVVGSDTDLLAVSLAGRLCAADRNVFLPGRWTALSESEPIDGDLLALAEQRSASAGRSIEAEARIAEAQAAAATAEAAKDPAAQKRALTVADDYQRASAAHALAQKAFDEFMTVLGTADASGVPPVARIAEQKFAGARLAAGAAAVVLNVHAALGGSYSKKNLWTFFGGMPFYVTGGAVASFAMFDADGRVLAAAQYQKHGGYWQVEEVATVVNFPA